MASSALPGSSRGLHGSVTVPGDKSISHRAAIFGSIAAGTVKITNFANSADCLSSLDCVRALGVPVETTGSSVVLHGLGMRGLREPSDILDCGNSGTTMRLLCGLLCSQDFFAILTGDGSLRRRPMARIVEPLRRMGASISARENDRYAPIAINGSSLRAIDHSLRVASAQVKSALLLAGLAANGETVIHEPAASRDHSERLLRAMGVRLKTSNNTVRLIGGQQPRAIDIDVPGDLSSAAFLLVAAAIVPGSDLTVRDVGINPTRTGLLDALAQMGAPVEVFNQREANGEPVADLRVKATTLAGTVIEGPLVPRLIDELPVLAVAATQASGRTVVRNAEELRVKETDRIAAVVAELRKLGAVINATDDGFVVDGPQALHGADCSSHGDHRMAMALSVAALVADGTTTIDDMSCVAVSFPSFLEVLRNVALP